MRSTCRPSASEGGGQHPVQISSPLIDVITRHHRNPNTAPLQDIVRSCKRNSPARGDGVSGDVGSLGMVVALDFDAKMGERVPPHAFSPMPKVQSRLLRMTLHEEEALRPAPPGANDSVSV